MTTHSMLVIGEYLLHSYWMMFPFRIVKITDDIVDCVNSRNFDELLGI